MAPKSRNDNATADADVFTNRYKPYANSQLCHASHLAYRRWYSKSYPCGIGS